MKLKILLLLFALLTSEFLLAQKDDGYHQFMFEYYTGLADDFIERGEYDSAIFAHLTCSYFFQKEVFDCTPAQKKEDLIKLLDSNEIEFDVPEITKVTINYWSVARILYYYKKDMKASLEFYAKTSKLLEIQARKNSLTDKEKEIWIDDINNAHEEWIEVLLSLSTHYEDGLKYVMAALSVSERARLQKLQKKMSSALGSRIYNVQFIPQRFEDRDDLDYLEFEANKMVQLAQEAGNSTILYYYVGDRNLYYWIFFPYGKICFNNIPIESDSIEILVKSLLESINNNESIETSISDLSNEIIPKEIIQVTIDSELLIIPHRSLNSIPFSQLISSTGQVIGAKHAIRYAPSLSVLSRIEHSRYMAVVDKVSNELRHKKTPSDSFSYFLDNRVRAIHRNSRFTIDSALIVGNPKMPLIKINDELSIKLSQLPHSEAEVTDVATRFNSVFLNGEGATETRILKEISKFSLVHLATHSKIIGEDKDNQGLYDSWVALASDDTNDGVLTLRELAENDYLNAELVVLSSCESGVGNSNIEEGSTGFQSVLLSLGTYRLLVSLWKVNDLNTKELMKNFYSHWILDKDLPSLSESLKRAKNDMRQDPRYSKSIDYEGFVLIGAY